MPERDYIQRLAAQRYDGEIENRLQEAIARVQNKADLDRIAEAIQSGNTEMALVAAGLLPSSEEFAQRGQPANDMPQGLQDEFKPVEDATLGAMSAGGGATQSAIPPRREPDGRIVKFTFNPGNDRAVRRTRDLHVDKIREVANETREAIRRDIAEGIDAGENPITTARKVRNKIGLTRRQSQFIRRAEDELRSGDPKQLRRYLGRKLRDRRYDRSILKAIQEGTAPPESTIQKAVEGYNRKWIRHRSETIARDQSLSALSMGQDEAMEQAKDQGVVKERELFKEWVTAGDARVREAHSSVPAMNRGGIPRSEFFNTPFGQLLRPRHQGSPGSVPANLVMCRCSLLIRVKREPNTRMIGN